MRAGPERTLLLFGMSGASPEPVLPHRSDPIPTRRAQPDTPLAEGDLVAALRRVLLALVFLGAGGLGLELLLLEHFESAWQWAPLALLAALLVACAVLVVRPSPGAVRIFQVVAALCVVAGLVGVYLHYRGNVEFELEREPLRRGLALFWEASRGATPALAPGALSQLGLLGLAYTFRHPALRRSSSVRRPASNANSPERT
jgi:hypothetical protein